MVDMFFYRDPTEERKEEDATKAIVGEEQPAVGVSEWDAPAAPAMGGVDPGLATGKHKFTIVKLPK